MKEIIVSKLLAKLEVELLHSKEALQSTKDLAQSDDIKSESKWDTRGIEAGYLAGAQEKRVKELEIEIEALKKIDLTNKDEIIPGAIIETSEHHYFLTMFTGGHKILINEITYTVISKAAPITQKLLDDEIEILSIH